mmetsp:Transcript_5818/g.11087  ORF Transcript_5818/g.11087 Transcript_5818/m.11087 type:complete len:106 (+) Transcript_5818:535-852(+)
MLLKATFLIAADTEGLDVEPTLVNDVRGRSLGFDLWEVDALAEGLAEGMTVFRAEGFLNFLASAFLDVDLEVTLGVLFREAFIPSCLPLLSATAPSNTRSLYISL